MPFDETFRRSVVGLSLIGGVCSAAFSVAATGWRYLKARGGSVTGIPDLPGLTDGRPVAGTAAAVASGLPGSDGRPGVGLGVGLPDVAAPAGPLGSPGLGGGEDRARLLHILSSALTTQCPAASPEPHTARNPAHKEIDMSWLSTIKNNLVALVTNAAPSNEQQAAHQAATGVATAIGNALTVLEGVAEQGLEDLLVAKLGPTAPALAYDFLTLLEQKITAKKATIALPALTPLSAPAQAPAASPSEPATPAN